MRVQIDNDMLMQIARADYGMGASEIYEELLPIRNRGVIASPLSFWAHEVLMLTQYCRPESPNEPPFEPGPSGIRGHWTRLFACAVLQRAAADLPHDDPSEDSALVQGLASARLLGDAAIDAYGRFLTWRTPSVPIEGVSRHLPWLFALLYVAVKRRTGRLGEAQLLEIANWVLEEEARDRAALPIDVCDPRPASFSSQSGYWTPLTADLLSLTESFQDETLRINLQLCAMIVEA